MKALQIVGMTLKQFEEQPLRLKIVPMTGWITGPYFQAYVRRSLKLIDGQYVHTFEISKVQIIDSGRKKGYYSRFLAKIKAQVREDYLYFDSVQETRIQEILWKDGWKLVPGCNSKAPSFYFKKKVERVLLIRR